jgi:hypothetical protein
MNSQHACFDTIAEALLSETGVTDGTGFGNSPGLRINGRIFAMPAADGLTLKLPAADCVKLIDAGDARPYEGGRGRPLREWVVVSGGTCRSWQALARASLSHVDASSARGRKSPESS